MYLNFKYSVLCYAVKLKHTHAFCFLLLIIFYPPTCVCLIQIENNVWIYWIIDGSCTITGKAESTHGTLLKSLQESFETRIVSQ